MMKNAKTFAVLMANILVAGAYGVILAYATVNMIAPPAGNQYFGLASNTEVARVSTN